MTAQMALDGPMNWAWFRAYFQQVLAPTLKAGDVMIMDNLAAHKRAPVREAVEAVSARMLFLSPFSPGLNPIENVFVKLKALLTKTAARTLEQLLGAIARIIQTYLPHACTHYFTAAGYAAD